MFWSCQTVGTENNGALRAPYRRQLRVLLVSIVRVCCALSASAVMSLCSLWAIRFSSSRRILVYVLLAPAPILGCAAAQGRSW